MENDGIEQLAGFLKSLFQTKVHCHDKTCRFYIYYQGCAQKAILIEKDGKCNSYEIKEEIQEVK